MFNSSVLFTIQLQRSINQAINNEKAWMVCMGFEPGDEDRKSQMNPLSSGGFSIYCESISLDDCVSCNEDWRLEIFLLPNLVGEFCFRNFISGLLGKIVSEYRKYWACELYYRCVKPHKRALTPDISSSLKRNYIFFKNNFILHFRDFQQLS